MNQDLGNRRKDYVKYTLGEADLTEHPVDLFGLWYGAAEKMIVHDANAMTLSTVSKNGMPSSRIVLLKEFSKEGFIFYTNYNSDKGEQIESNSKVALNFFWLELERQVRIEGKAEKVSPGKSDEYFMSRPIDSQIAAIASGQSKEMANRDVLEEKVKQLNKRYQNEPIQRPAHWGGYVVKPSMIEFWQGRANRLHDRFRYILEKGSWRVNRLSP